MQYDETGVEDEKFEEGLNGVLAKNQNFRQFKDMQSKILSPNKMAHLNNM